MPKTSAKKASSAKKPPAAALRLGLCCTFDSQPIKFRTTTITSLQKLKPTERLEKLSGISLDNARALQLAFEYCHKNSIGCFRVLSQILPAKTHPEVGYQIAELPDSVAIIEAFQRAGRYAAQHNIRTVFHPDQFVVLNSQRPEVIENSIAELEYQAEVAEWIGADVINIHGGGAFGNKAAALDAFCRTFDRLSAAVRSRLTVENDDKIYTPEDLLPICRDAELPLVYDPHHHRCLPDELSIDAATEEAAATWGNREPLFHISSPLAGWHGPKPHRHHDYIDVSDFPECWLDRKLTVEVEAKAKELAVHRLQADLRAVVVER